VSLKARKVVQEILSQSIHTEASFGNGKLYNGEHCQSALMEATAQESSKAIATKAQ